MLLLLLRLNVLLVSAVITHLLALPPVLSARMPLAVLHAMLVHILTLLLDILAVSPVLLARMLVNLLLLLAWSAVLVTLLIRLVRVSARAVNRVHLPLRRAEIIHHVISALLVPMHLVLLRLVVLCALMVVCLLSVAVLSAVYVTLVPMLTLRLDTSHAPHALLVHMHSMQVRVNVLHALLVLPLLLLVLVSCVLCALLVPLPLLRVSLAALSVS